MQDIELKNIFDYHFTVGDVPEFEEDGVAVYLLISQFQDIEIKVGGHLIAKLKHIAIRGSDGKVFAYDVGSKTNVALLGSVAKVHRR